MAFYLAPPRAAALESALVPRVGNRAGMIGARRARVIAVVWQFQVKAGRQQDFEKFYGADGEWSTWARRSRSFLGSSFLRDESSGTSYLLIEYLE